MGTGRFTERGRGAGQGCTVNVPIPAGSGDRVLTEVLRRVLNPILAGYRPELILVSLGTDAYYADEFSQLELTSRSYGELASTLRRYRARHPQAGIAATLEGGVRRDQHGLLRPRVRLRPVRKRRNRAWRSGRDRRSRPG